MTMNLEPYLPVILFILIGAAVGVLPQVIGFIFGPNRPDKAKNSPYECGFEAFEDARMKFDVRYYLVAILFIIFDLETAFLFPWGVALRDIGWPHGGMLEIHQGDDMGVPSRIHVAIPPQRGSSIAVSGSVREMES